MFREMRRKAQQLPQAVCEEVLRRGTSGVLATVGEDGYPYAVPLSYVFDGSKIYFHGAKRGHKLDNLAHCDKVSFCVTGQDEVDPPAYTTHYRSVIVFGRARVMTDEAQGRAALEKLARRYYPQEIEAHLQKVIADEWAATAMIELTIEHITGKEERTLARQRAENDEKPA